VQRRDERCDNGARGIPSAVRRSARWRRPRIVPDATLETCRMPFGRPLNRQSTWDHGRPLPRGTREQSPCPDFCQPSEQTEDLDPSYVECGHGRSQIAFRNTWKFLPGWSLRSGAKDSPNLDTTFDHETFEPLDASVHQRAQLILTISRHDRSDKRISRKVNNESKMKMRALDCPG